MLNRLFIVVGSLAILAMVAAFIVPRFYDWNPYRARLEAIAEEALGTPVTIRGDLEFTILPQPRMTLSDVLVGPEGAPVAEVARIEAEFELMEFLRDRYEVTELLLDAPTIGFRIDADGRVAAPFRLAHQVRTTNVSIENARITNGTISLADSRTGQSWVAENVDAGLRLQALRGPFSVQATGRFQDHAYQLRVNTSDANEAGDIRLTVFLRPVEGRFTVSSEGVLSTSDDRPKYAGSVAWRHTPEPSSDVRLVRGSSVLDGNIEASPERVLLSSFTYLPDEARAGTRLSGAAEVKLGSEPEFNAVVSGGVVSLLEARDVREDVPEEPYALLALLDDLPSPPVMGLPGRIGVDVAELDLRGLSLRDVRLDARTDGADWQVEQFSGRLAGETTIALSGRSVGAPGEPNFEGTVSVSSQRLDALARTWREQTEDNPLFGATGNLAASVSMSASGMALRGGTADIDGNGMTFAADITRWPAPMIDVTANLGTLDGRGWPKLAALLPDAFRSRTFAASFPQGSLQFEARRLVFNGEELRDLSASASWSSDGLEIDRFAAGDVAGTRVTGSGLLSGSPAAPHLVGSARLELVAGSRVEDLWSLLPAPALAPQALTVLRASRPLHLELALADGEGAEQVLEARAVSGQVSGSGRVTLKEGIFAAHSKPFEVEFDLAAPDRTALATAMGVPPAVAAGLVTGETVTFSGSAGGSFAGAIEADLSYAAGEERIAYQGLLELGDPLEVSGKGRIEAQLADFAGYAEVLGLGGLSLPAVVWAADIAFSGGDEIALSNIDAVVGGERVAGTLSLNRSGGALAYGGTLETGRVELNALAAFLGGAASLVPGEGAWPIGPVSVGDGTRPSSGRIAIAAERLVHDGVDLLDHVGFEFAWDGMENRIRELSGTLGEGEVRVDARICCASDLRSKQLTGRFSIDGVELDLLVPSALAARLGGAVRANGQFSGSGASYADIVESLGGEGGFAVDGVSVEGFNPAVFARIAEIDNVVEMEPQALANAVAEALGTGPLEVESIEGLFNIAAGSVRVSNLVAETGHVRLLGSGALQLADFRLDSSWTMAPAAPVGGNGLITETSGRVTALISGSLDDPQGRLDVAQMVDALKVRAYEIEVARLERLRAEDEARIRTAAAENQRQLALEFIAKTIAARERAAREAVTMAFAAIARDRAREEALRAEEESRRQAELAAWLGAQIEAARAAALAALPGPVVEPTPEFTPPPSSMQILVPPDEEAPILLLPR